MLWSSPRHVGLCEKTTGGGESTFGEQVLSLAFFGDRFETAFLFFAFPCHPPYNFIFGKVLGCKRGGALLGKSGKRPC